MKLVDCQSPLNPFQSRFLPSHLALLLRDAKRRSAKLGAGVTDKSHERRYPTEQNNYSGLKVEALCAALLNAEYFTYDGLKGDPGWDVMYRGITIECKFGTGDLIFDFKTEKDKRDPFSADYAVLGSPLRSSPPDPNVDKPPHKFIDVYLVGWISRVEFLQRYETKDYTHGDRRKMDPSELYVMSSFKAELDRVACEGLDTEQEVRTPRWPMNQYLRDFLATDEGKRIRAQLRGESGSAQSALPLW